jgi:glutamate mutase epsilon subunit
LQTAATGVNITQTLEVITLQSIIKLLQEYFQTAPFNTGDPDCKTVLDQLFLAYQESHETDPPDIREGFRELDVYLKSLSLDDNNAVWKLCCRLCTAYEYKAFIDGLHYGAQLMIELK